MLSWEVVDVHVSRKKQVRTEAFRRIRRMVYPVSLQKLSLLQSGGEASLCREGVPEVVDAVELAEWPILAGGLRRWRSEVVAASDKIRIAEFSSVAAGPWDFHSRVPLIITMDELAANGWKSVSGQPSQQHARRSPRVYRAKDPLSAWAYLQCLVLLDELLDNGEAWLPSDQPARYYECVLHAGRLEGVPLGQ